MSYEFRIESRTDRLPSPAAWNDAIRADGFDIEVEPFEWDSHSGYLPARVLGIQSGFELHTERSEVSGYSLIAVRLGGREMELVAGATALAVLARITEGTYHDDDGRTLSAHECLVEASEDYRRGYVLLTHARARGRALIEDEPALLPGESLESRRELLERLVAQKQMNADEADGHRVYSLRRRIREALNEELNFQPDKADG